eukprot:m.20029 g.20029  ORF g.20029 m.20029 type:complete len:1049 (+) comp6731_c0_seq1:213-3359(+)
MDNTLGSQPSSPSNVNLDLKCMTAWDAKLLNYGDDVCLLDSNGLLMPGAYVVRGTPATYTEVVVSKKCEQQSSAPCMTVKHTQILANPIHSSFSSGYSADTRPQRHLNNSNKISDGFEQDLFGFLDIPNDGGLFLPENVLLAQTVHIPYSFFQEIPKRNTATGKQNRSKFRSLPLNLDLRIRTSNHGHQQHLLTNVDVSEFLSTRTRLSPGPLCSSSPRPEAESSPISQALSMSSQGQTTSSQEQSVSSQQASHPMLGVVWADALQEEKRRKHKHSLYNEYKHCRVQRDGFIQDVGVVKNPDNDNEYELQGRLLVVEMCQSCKKRMTKPSESTCEGCRAEPRVKELRRARKTGELRGSSYITEGSILINMHMRGSCERMNNIFQKQDTSAMEDFLRKTPNLSKWVAVRQPLKQVILDANFTKVEFREYKEDDELDLHFAIRVQFYELTDSKTLIKADFKKDTCRKHMQDFIDTDKTMDTLTELFLWNYDPHPMEDDEMDMYEADTQDADDSGIYTGNDVDSSSMEQSNRSRPQQQNRIFGEPMTDTDDHSEDSNHSTDTPPTPQVPSDKNGSSNPGKARVNNKPSMREGLLKHKISNPVKKETEDSLKSGPSATSAKSTGAPSKLYSGSTLGKWCKKPSGALRNITNIVSTTVTQANTRSCSASSTRGETPSDGTQRTTPASNELRTTHKSTNNKLNIKQEMEVEERNDKAGKKRKMRDSDIKVEEQSSKNTLPTSGDATPPLLEGSVAPETDPPRTRRRVASTSSDGGFRRARAHSSSQAVESSTDDSVEIDNDPENSLSSLYLQFNIATSKENTGAPISSMTDHMWWILVDWMTEVQMEFSLSQESLFLGVSILKRYLRKETVSRNQMQLIAAVALLIAAKYDEIYPPEVDEYVYMCAGAYTRAQLLQTEIKVLCALEFQVYAPFSLHFLMWMMQQGNLDKKTSTLALFFLESTLRELSFQTYRADVLAITCLNFAFQVRQIPSDEWRSAKKHCKTVTMDEIVQCGKKLNDSIISRLKDSSTNMHVKYADGVGGSKFLRIGHSYYD